MEKLINALGDDGLDEFDVEQLRALTGDEDESGEGSEDEGSEEEGSVGEEQEGSDAEEDDEAQSEDEDAIPVDELSDEEELDEDAETRQKVEIDNGVRPHTCLPFHAC